MFSAPALQATQPTLVTPMPRAVTGLPGSTANISSGMAELSVDDLVQQVLARNPSLAQMTATWQAASARYPQVTSLDDPMFGTTVAPASIGSRVVDFGYRVEVSQKYLWPGKLALRGQNALAEASAAGHDVEDMRLQLIESSQTAFYDYYLVGRALAVNRESVKLLKEILENAQSRYKTGLVTEEDVLQAVLEIAKQEERQLLLERMWQVAIARINTLLNLPPDSPLPPPPVTTPPPQRLPEVALLRSYALAQRPDLHALADHIKAEQASLGLAQKDFCPDFEVSAAYDTIMGNGPMKDLAPQVGVRLNLPIRKARRYGALAEAQARLAQRHAELEKQIAQVNMQVQEAVAQVQESEKVMALYKDKLVPAALASVKAAQADYVTGKTPFLVLIEAERNVVAIHDRRYEVIADYFRRKATLERVIGGPLIPAVEADRPCPVSGTSSEHPPRRQITRPPG